MDTAGLGGVYRESTCMCVGGMGTAGLGGVGGPYRLSGGEAEVFQVPDWQKDQVPEQVSKPVSPCCMCVHTCP